MAQVERPSDLLSPEELQIYRQTLLTVEQIRELVSGATIKVKHKGVHIDPLQMLEISLCHEGDLFIVGSNVYTYEELARRYELQQAPVDLRQFFERQHIGLFLTSAAGTDRAHGRAVVTDDNCCHLVAADAGDTQGMITAQGALSGIAQTPNRVVQTNIYVGRQRWKRFRQFHGFVHTARELLPQIEGGMASLLQIAAPPGGPVGQDGGDHSANALPSPRDSESLPSPVQPPAYRTSTDVDE